MPGRVKRKEVSLIRVASGDATVVFDLDFENSIHPAAVATRDTKTTYASSLNEVEPTQAYFAENLNTVV